MIMILLLQAAVPAVAPAPATAPDIELRVRATAESVRIEQKGTTSLKVVAEPDAGSLVDVKVPPVNGVARNVTVAIDAQVRIADPGAAPPR